MITRIVVAGTDYIIDSVQFDGLPNVGDFINYRVDDHIQTCAIALTLKVTARTWELSDNKCRAPELLLYVTESGEQTRQYIKEELLKHSKKARQV